jgi:hypothetical protein
MVFCLNRSNASDFAEHLIYTSLMLLSGTLEKCDRPFPLLHRLDAHHDSALILGQIQPDPDTDWP